MTINEEIDEIPVQSMLKFLDIVYKQLTDRTLTQIPRIVSTVRLVYNVSFTEAIVKTCEFVAKDKISTVASQIEPKEITKLKTKVVQIPGLSDQDFLKSHVNDIITEIKNVSNNVSTPGSLVTEDDINSIMSLLKHASSGNEQTAKIYNNAVKSVKKFNGFEFQPIQMVTA
jgi:adenylosuccinate synthase